MYCYSCIHLFSCMKVNFSCKPRGESLPVATCTNSHVQSHYREMELSCSRMRVSSELISGRYRKCVSVAVGLELRLTVKDGPHQRDGRLQRNSSRSFLAAPSVSSRPLVIPSMCARMNTQVHASMNRHLYVHTQTYIHAHKHTRGGSTSLLRHISANCSTF